MTTSCMAGRILFEEGREFAILNDDVSASRGLTIETAAIINASTKPPRLQSAQFTNFKLAIRVGLKNRHSKKRLHCDG
jgi:hypothetical protein